MESPLSEYFNAESHGEKWHLFCKGCGKGWELPKGDTHPGNLLHLLNHARSHKAAQHRLHQTAGGRGSKKTKLVVPAAGKA